MALVALLNLEDTRDQNKQQQQQKIINDLFWGGFLDVDIFHVSVLQRSASLFCFVFSYDDNSLLFFYNVIESLREKVGQFLFCMMIFKGPGLLL